jgi:hypothetical protein
MKAQSSSRTAALLLAPTLGGICLLLVSIAAVELVSPSHLADPNALKNDYFRVVELSLNSFHFWRLDPLVKLIVDTLFTAPSELLFQHVAIQCFIFGAGVMILIAVTLPSAPKVSNMLGSLLAALILISILLRLFGSNPILFGTLAWLPLFISLFTSAATERLGALGSFTLGLLILSRLLLSANQLLLPVLLLGGVLLGVYLLVGSGLSVRLLMLHRVLLILTALGAIWVSTSSPFPDRIELPSGSAFVPATGAPGLVRPLIGPDPDIQVVNREQVRATVGGISKLLLCLNLLLLMLYLSVFRARQSPVASFTLAGSVAAAVIVAWDVLFVESFAQIGPLGALARITPGTITIALVPVASALALGMSFAVSLALLGLFRTNLLFAVVLLATGVLSSTPEINSSSFAWHRFREDPNSIDRNRLVSPSFFFFSQFDSSGKTQLPTENSLNRVRVRPTVLVSSNWNEQTARLLRDRDYSTRWSTGSGSQSGKEWIYLVFDAPVEVQAVRLSTGAFHSDFPRGLEISSFNDCPVPFGSDPSDPILVKQLSEITGDIILFNQMPWLGSPRTNNDGVGYFTPQHQVFPIFSEPYTLSCLLIKQVGKDHNFDWSVAELRIYSSTSR